VQVTNKRVWELNFTMVLFEGFRILMFPFPFGLVMLALDW
jgi:hypothetical protein